MKSTLKELADITNFPDSLMDAIDWRRCESIPIFQFMLELVDPDMNSEQCMFTDLCDELSGACIDDEERNPEKILPELEKEVNHLSTQILLLSNQIRTTIKNELYFKNSQKQNELYSAVKEFDELCVHEPLMELSLYRKNSHSLVNSENLNNSKTDTNAGCLLQNEGYVSALLTIHLVLKQLIETLWDKHMIFQKDKVFEIVDYILEKSSRDEDDQEFKKDSLSYENSYNDCISDILKSMEIFKTIFDRCNMETGILKTINSNLCRIEEANRNIKKLGKSVARKL